MRRLGPVRRLCPTAIALVRPAFSSILRHMQINTREGAGCADGVMWVMRGMRGGLGGRARGKSCSTHLECEVLANLGANWRACRLLSAVDACVRPARCLELQPDAESTQQGGWRASGGGKLQECCRGVRARGGRCDACLPPLLDVRASRTTRG